MGLSLEARIEALERAVWSRGPAIYRIAPDTMAVTLDGKEFERELGEDDCAFRLRLQRMAAGRPTAAYFVDPDDAGLG